MESTCFSGKVRNRCQPEVIRVSDLSAGIVEAVGEEVSRWKIGDKVCALLDGGGYAEKVAVSASQVLPIPEGVSLVDAASFLEVASAVWSTVFRMTNINAGQTFLVHGRASAAGAIAIQLAKFRGARVFGTAGGEEKLAVWKDLVADVCIDYKTEDFVARVKEETGGKGVDIVLLDSIEESYLQRNLESSLYHGGRLFMLGFQARTVARVDFGSFFFFSTLQTARGRLVFHNYREQSREQVNCLILKMISKLIPPPLFSLQGNPIV